MKKPLTKDNYHSSDNQYLSHSKISDFEKDKAYFKNLHIDRVISRDPTPSMILGSAVDAILTESEEKFHQLFSKAVLKKDDPELFEDNKTSGKLILTAAQWDTVMEIKAVVERQDAYKEIKDYTSQAVLTVDQPISKYFEGLCGMLDWLHIDGTHAEIVDLKTTRNAAHRAFHYSCVDHNYYRQQAMYQMLVRTTHPKVKTINSRILAVQTSGDVYRVEAFKIDKQVIVEETKNLVELIKKIHNEKKFLPNNVGWGDAKTLPINQE